MSSSNYFRSWIDRPHLDPNTRLLTEEYQRGITEFMGLVHRQPEAKTGAQRPPVVAPGDRSRLRERPGGVAARRRSGSPFASDLAVSLRSRRSGSLWPSRSERVSQRLHGVAPVRSLPRTARPMITFITSFELQMRPNVSKNFMWPLSRNEFKQTEGVQRPQVVAPRGRSRIREQPGGVAARRRSGSLFASDLAESLRSRRSG
ncbi:hypothetical protein DY000_02040030 [Brassica cretica]|uniref:Uncharacterized protein n=1 Tax=Brassica cretica TaxID=69181 RepID=A0ABQ7BLU6_BRACR|nr:hypothetical protein DY000_02040030 [Brassica cretica]